MSFIQEVILFLSAWVHFHLILAGFSIYRVHLILPRPCFTVEVRSCSRDVLGHIIKQTALELQPRQPSYFIKPRHALVVCSLLHKNFNTHHFKAPFTCWKDTDMSQNVSIFGQVTQHAPPRPGEHLDILVHTHPLRILKHRLEFFFRAHPRTVQARLFLAWRRPRITQERTHQKLSWAQPPEIILDTNPCGPGLALTLPNLCVLCPREPAKPQIDAVLPSFGGEASISSELLSKSASHLPYISEKLYTQIILHLIVPQNNSFCLYQNILTFFQWQA